MVYDSYDGDKCVCGGIVYSVENTLTTLRLLTCCYDEQKWDMLAGGIIKLRFFGHDYCYYYLANESAGDNAR